MCSSSDPDRFCSEVVGHWASPLLLAIEADYRHGQPYQYYRRAAVVECGTGRVAAVLPFGVSTFGRTLFLPHLDCVVVASWEGRTLQGYRLSDGKSLWRHKGIKEISRICEWIPPLVIVRRDNGAAFEVDALSGRIGPEMRRVSNLWSDPRQARILIEKTPRRDRPCRVELVRSITDAAVEWCHPESDGFTLARFGNGWTATRGYGEDASVSGFDSRGALAWRIDPEDGWVIWSLFSVESDEQVGIEEIRRERDKDTRARQIRMSRVVGRTGERTFVRALPMMSLPLNCELDHGRYVAKRDGVVSTSTFEWTPIQYQIPEVGAE